MTVSSLFSPFFKIVYIGSSGPSVVIADQYFVCLFACKSQNISDKIIQLHSYRYTVNS